MSAALIAAFAVDGSRGQGTGAGASGANDPFVLAAGDIARCDRGDDERTAALVAAELRRNERALVLTLGDNVYPAGRARTYERCYGPSWGRFKARTRPSPGNHDVLEPSADGGRHYRRYFGVRDYYAFDFGTWRLYSLDSEATSHAKQAAWLERDLRTHRRACVLAYMHRPRFTVGLHNSDRSVAPLWEVLYRHHADVVLGGHDHNYQRFEAQDPAGKSRRDGIVQFVVGTGGEGLYPVFPDRRTPTTRFASGSTFGVLRLTLRRGSYEWRFLPVSGRALVNRLTGKREVEFGRARCV